MKNYTIVIPTMWKSLIIDQLLDECVNSKLITQIILIDNNPSLKKKLTLSDKIN
jgi:hypothetical protein